MCVCVRCMFAHSAYMLIVIFHLQPLQWFQGQLANSERGRSNCCIYVIITDLPYFYYQLWQLDKPLPYLYYVGRQRFQWQRRCYQASHLPSSVGCWQIIWANTHILIHAHPPTCLPTHTHTHDLTNIHVYRYHHNAYFAQQVGVVVRQEAPTRFIDYVQLMFDQQDSKQKTTHIL